MPRIPFVFATLSLSLVLGLARAQDGVSLADPPDRAARLSLVEGDVSLQPAGEQAWAPAILNRPLTTGDSLWTEPGARAEVQVGPAAVRLDDNTGFSFLNLGDDAIQMRVSEGVISVGVRALNESDRIEIITPNLTLTLLHPGSYRVEVNPAGDTTIVKVREGEIQARGSLQNVIVRAEQVVTFTGVTQLTSQFATLGDPDEFDEWTRDREARDYLASSRSLPYVAPDVTGYEDLDEHGTWSSDPEYGNVWTPSHVGAGWSPYSYGRWLWVSPWGWTWIDDAPWGYAPFHYGRWAHSNNRWCWVPGPRHGRSVYAPAHVGWGGSARGHVSWFPLGPRDVYMPDGRYSRRYIERVNVTNAAIVRSVVHEVYDNRARGQRSRNLTVPGAVTAVSRSTFTTAERVGDRRVRIDDQEIARTQTTALSPQLAPLRESRLGGTPRTHVSRPSQAEVTRQVIMTRRPSPEVRVSQPAQADRQASGEVALRTPPVQQPAPAAQPRLDAQEIARQVRERHEADRSQRQQQQTSERQPAVRPAPQRERPAERPRVEQRQQESRASQPTVQKPAETAQPRQRDDQPRSRRN